MKLYSCSNCDNPLYFENNICLNCLHAVGFDKDTIDLLTLQKKEGNQYADISHQKKLYRYCENALHGTCNWLVPMDAGSPFCEACQLNRTIPTLSSPENLNRWKRIEIAKHRLVYSLLRLQLPFHPKENEESDGIAFDFMADVSPENRIMTGHNNGTITLNIEEADEEQRVRHKLDLGERYRTLLGHFRHETGHYYWEVLVKDKPAIEKFRQLFGDEQKDYAEALKKYYITVAPANWQDGFISPYATAHTWEDWAETWAHYFHLMDTVETAYAFGIHINPVAVHKDQEMQANIDRDPYRISSFDAIIKMWIPFTFAINSLNRSIGHEDFYPFVISPVVINKLQFVHEVCLGKRLSATKKK